MMTLSCNKMFFVSYDILFQPIALCNIRLSFFIIAINDNIKLQHHICHILQYIISTHSFAQYQIIFLHYCDNIYFLITVCNGDMEQVWCTPMWDKILPHITPPQGYFYIIFTYDQLVTSRVNPQQHNQPTNTTTMVMEPLAPPAAWI